jgi:hypothetical protein
MEKVLVNPTLSFSMHDFFLPPKVTMATKEVIVGICVSLHETKQSNFIVKLIAKHCILVATIGAGGIFC